MTTENQQIKIAPPGGTVEELQHTQAQLEELERKYTKHFGDAVGRKRKIREILGGACCICDGIPDYKVSYDASDLDYHGDRRGATKIEFYCAECMKKCYAREPVL
jgi:hypothetical protein